ncbi:MAG: DUF1292 domain-containing protein [Bacilli bacterium]|nr:DUF1292 domain-containing protein [Bacilli bacterium]
MDEILLDGVIEVNDEKLHVLFIFENNNKRYIVYVLKNGDISASILSDDVTLLPITTDEEWDMVDTELEKRDDLWTK